MFYKYICILKTKILKIKRLKHILFYFLIGLFSVILLIYILLWLPPVQQKVKDIAVSELNKITGGNISIGKLNFRPFNKIGLEDIFISTLNGDTLLYAKDLSVGFSLPKLIHNKLLIRSVVLDDFTIAIAKDSANAPYNFQFLIDAFSSSDTTETSGSSLVVEIDKIILKKGNLSYDILSEKPIEEGFDSNHIELSDFNTEISLQSIDVEKLDVTLFSLAFKENSGFELKNLSTKIYSSGKKITLDKLNIELPNSEININNSFVDYTGFEIEQMMSRANYSFSLNIPQLIPADLQAFYLPLKNNSDTLKFNTTVSGKFPEINAEMINVKLSNYFELDMSALIDNYEHWDTTLFALNINKLTAEKRFYKTIDTFTGTGSSSGFYPENFNLTGKITGSLDRSFINLNAITSTGNLNIQGTGGYDTKTSEINFNTQIKTSGLNMKSLLSEPSLGLLNMDLITKGRIKGNYINSFANVSINQFDYNGYRYEDLKIDVSYVNDSVDLNIFSKDKNLPLELKAYAQLAKGKESAGLYAKINHARLDTLNFVPEYKNADVSLILNADVKSFDIEKMQAFFSIDSLLFSCYKGTFRQEKIRLNYSSSDDAKKSIHISSDLLNGNIQGKIKFADLAQSFSNTLSTYLPAYFDYKKGKKHSEYYWDANLKIENTDSITTALDIPFNIIEPATITTKYDESKHFVGLDIALPKVKINDMVLSKTMLDLQTDTIRRRMHVSANTMKIENTDSLLIGLNALAGHDSIFLSSDIKNLSAKNNIDANIALNAYLNRIKGQKIPDIFVDILPSDMRINEQKVKINPAQLSIQDKRYSVKNFKISFSDGEYLSVNGVVSENNSDTLIINPSHIRIETLMQAMMSDLDLQGEIDGKFILTQLFTSPRFFTDGLKVKDIILENKKIGNVNLASKWNDDTKGIDIQATLTQDNAPTSTVSGFIIPGKDSLSVNADIKAIALDWISPFTKDFLYGLNGSIGAQIKATGKLSAPELSGKISFSDAKFGINMTNTLYSISDDILITPQSISLKDFNIKDENDQTISINGKITHQNFASFNPDINLKMRNFLLVNNPEATDSLFYGTLKMNGTIKLSMSENNLLADMVLSNSGTGKVFVKLPESQAQAQQFTGITFINPADSLIKVEKKESKENNTSLPVKLKLALSVSPELTLGTVINPETKDEASVNGQGNIDFSYDMANDNMNLTGSYTINDGKCSISLKNITRKTFNIKPGSEVNFHGDPMKTSFDVTAVYALRSDLSTLDPSFESDGYLATTKVNVNCLINLSGNVDNMKITYDIDLPNSSEETKRKVAGLIFSDDIKIKEIAYLLTVGTFWAPENSAGKPGSNLWTSLASSTLTTQLNNLLSGVLNENWTIGTELHADDQDMSNLEMDVNVSTKLFNDRLTVTGNLGYKNTTTKNTNFTGDFEVQYKLTKSGDFVLKMYNVTNDQYYEQALTTQGVGIVYKKEAKTFKNLFRKIKAKFGK